MRARRGEAQEMLLRLLLTKSADCIVWPFSVSSAGYGQIAASDTFRNVHVIACENFHGPRPEGMQVAHSCANRRCMNRDHVRWATPAENSADQVLHGTRVRGEAVGVSRLTEADIHVIRDRSHTARELAMRFGVSVFTINAIRRGTRWGHVQQVAS